MGTHPITDGCMGPPSDYSFPTHFEPSHSQSNDDSSKDALLLNFVESSEGLNNTSFYNTEWKSANMADVEPSARNVGDLE